MASNPSDSNGVCSTTDAIRSSVCRSEGGGTGIRAGAVTSTTKDLRLAYPAVECNIPLIP